MKVNLQKLINSHGGEWVAFNKGLNSVVASGRTVKKVLQNAHKKGQKMPYLFKVPTKLVAYSYSY